MLLNNCSVGVQRQFVKELTMVIPIIPVSSSVVVNRPGTTDDKITPPPVTMTIHVPNLSSLDEASESELGDYGALEGYVVLDEVKETENVATSEFPN